MPATIASVLAHQGGWDELLFVAVPLVIFAGLLIVARRRVDALEREGDGLPGSIAARADRDANGKDPSS